MGAVRRAFEQDVRRPGENVGKPSLRIRVVELDDVMTSTRPFMTHSINSAARRPPPDGYAEKTRLNL